MKRIVLIAVILTVVASCKKEVVEPRNMGCIPVEEPQLRGVKSTGDNNPTAGSGTTSTTSTSTSVDITDPNNDDYSRRPKGK